ncbi:MAG: hypothetical protein IJ774_05875 [Selenomonadaceae bacterium]|nr:hypothetical protein [Selenomonadaceae bacterium]
MAELLAELVIIPKFFIDGFDDAEQDFERVPTNPAATANVGENSELVHDKPSRLVYPVSETNYRGRARETPAEKISGIGGGFGTEHNHEHDRDCEKNFFVVKIFQS